MDREKAVKYGIILNTSLVILAALIWGLSLILDTFLTGNMIRTFVVVIGIAYPVVAVVILILAIITFIQLRKYKIKGSELLLASAIVTVIFSLIGIVIGIITFILSGISLRQMRESKENEEFREELANGK